MQSESTTPHPDVSWVLHMRVSGEQPDWLDWIEVNCTHLRVAQWDWDTGDDLKVNCLILYREMVRQICNHLCMRHQELPDVVDQFIEIGRCNTLLVDEQLPHLGKLMMELV